jgi:hypothetical protein
MVLYISLASIWYVIANPHPGDEINVNEFPKFLYSNGIEFLVLLVSYLATVTYFVRDLRSSRKLTQL